MPNEQSPLSYIKNPLVSIIIYEEENENGGGNSDVLEVAMHYGERDDIETGMGSQILYDGLVSGFKHHNEGAIRAMALILTVSESIKRDFPDIAAKVRELNLAFLKAKNGTGT